MSTRKKEPEQTLCIPGPTAWELWSLDGGASPSPIETLPLDEGGTPAGFRGATYFGIPVADAFSLPLWVASADPDMIRGAIEIQLESHGVKPDVAEGEHLEYQIVAQEENRTLVAATALPAAFARPLPRQHPTTYGVTPHFYYLPENQVVVWNELGRLAVVVTRGEFVIYFQGLTAEAFDRGAALELYCAVMNLRAQGVVETLEGVTLWLEDEAVPPDAAEFAQSLFGIPLTTAPKPAPAKPARRPALLPAAVAASRRLARRRARIRNVAIGVAALYAVAVLVFAGDVLLQQRKVTALKARVAQLEPASGWIPTVQSQWATFQPAIDVDAYPLETFLRLYELLPERGVRFTTFEVGRSRVTLMGEAQDTNAAIRFRNAVTASPELDHYEWTGPQPTPQRDRTTRFSVIGTHQDAVPES